MILLLIGATTVKAQHGHLHIGAQSQEQNAPLIWQNGEAFIESSGYVKTLNFAQTGRFSGYYEGNISLTALPATAANAGPHLQAPGLGSFIQFSFSSLSGPPGGAFAFWDVGTTEPSLSVPSGESSTNLWVLSESDGSAGSDPFGHIHGRRFTATKAGLYKIGFTAVDTSVNGAGGGPIHTPAPQLSIWFQAGVNILSVVRTGSVNTIHYASMAGRTFTLEAAERLSAHTQWNVVVEGMPGVDYFTNVVDANVTGSQRYYRLRIETPP